MVAETHALRVLDAESNRASEGLRVVDDYVRFVLDDAQLTKLVKQLRHELVASCAALPLFERHAARDTPRDVGTDITVETETARQDAWAVCVANLERIKQSLRSLEEYGKLVDTSFARRIEALRYQLYTLERCLSISDNSRWRLRDINLCLLLDGRDSEALFSDLVKNLLDAGVGMFQLRDKRLGDAELIERGRQLQAAIAGAGGEAILIVNDRPDIAAATAADGVHLGQDDMGVKDARAILGPQKLVGVSTHTIDQARQAVLDGANYLGAGPTFPSTTKSFDDYPGLAFLQQVATEISLPTFAIGGIDAGNLPQVRETGLRRVAVGGAVLGAVDPVAAARQLVELLA